MFNPKPKPKKGNHMFTLDDYFPREFVAQRTQQVLHEAADGFSASLSALLHRVSKDLHSMRDESFFLGVCSVLCEVDAMIEEFDTAVLDQPECITDEDLHAVGALVGQLHVLTSFVDAYGEGLDERSNPEVN